MTDVAEIRAEFIRFASRRQTRRVVTGQWRPTRVVDPRSGMVFTEAGAWDYLVEQLEADVPMQEVPMILLPGKVGYVMRLPAGRGRPFIYVKLRRGSGSVEGWSFHYDDHDRFDA